MEHLALVATDGTRLPERMKATENLDRGVGAPHFSENGKSIVTLVTDDRSVYPVMVDIADNRVTKLLQSPIVMSSPSMASTLRRGAVGRRREGDRGLQDGPDDARARAADAPERRAVL